MKNRDLRNGFTLVELLVAMAVVAILAAMVFGGIGAARTQADRSRAIANMRAIGSGIGLFTADNNGLLPGPLWPGQVAEFDPNRAGRLVRELAPYLGIETPGQPEVIGLFVPPALRRITSPAALSTTRPYVVNMSVQGGNATINPWGSLAANDGSGPARLAAIPEGAWAFSDADRLHPRVAGASWAANTAEKPFHGKRLAWFFNGSISAVEEADLR